MNAIRVKVAETLEELSTALTIRDMVFVAEYQKRFKFTRDPNDLAGVYLLSYVAEEPAATMRVRWFRDGAKFEFLSVRDEFRRMGVGRKIADAAIRLARAKGFDRVWGYPVKEMVPFWESYGWEPIAGMGNIELCGTTCYPMAGTVEPANEIITLSSHYRDVNLPENAFCEEAFGPSLTRNDVHSSLN